MSLPGAATGDEGEPDDALPSEGAADSIASRPPSRQRKLTWLLGATSVVVAIVLAVVASMLFSRQRDAGDTIREAAAITPDTRWASAGDMGAVSLVTDDPTCAEWTRISAALVDLQNRVLWFDRDGSIPAVEWSPEQAAMYTAVARAMGSVAVQTSGLVRATPHRVMREVYEQLIAYAQELINRIPQYQAADIEVTRTADALVGAASSICGAAISGSAQARAPLTAAALPPSNPLPASIGLNRRTLMADNPSICAEWAPMSTNYRSSMADWSDADWQAPAVDWTYDQQSAGDATASLNTGFADGSEQLSRRSNNPIAEDFAVLSAQYLRAHALALPTYVPADRGLADAAANLTKVVDHACAAVV
ncbi:MULTISPECIES: hypothetical protein [unclassified Mycolicibacterium]|uniref:hypothetical protein n=1 Tax=unclassified Mycolicibacterium TaxID=2636767 RepID=UPI0012DE0C00|nr:MULTISPECIES: hypothetical protein [unclassified Mycolicibacterium]MUL85144.1 hypothetical protein [Mycolicibacterium sp. CBMA 329]MUL91111.1 hypothetical protein [Mycolicibacterium sp. CBMA 331]MUL98219.1 hypothetical protein [Mycolicibacterium sp. CBMA 334]MUM26099.1 hypothetical protein [Mycolicibacterium sp. CBMA 295]MUM40870.1 hypothetical protein [Mycolicibacterium sp. CBMA 247]